MIPKAIRNPPEHLSILHVFTSQKERARAETRQRHAVEKQLAAESSAAESKRAMEREVLLRREAEDACSTATRRLAVLEQENAELRVEVETLTAGMTESKERQLAAERVAEKSNSSVQPILTDLVKNKFASFENLYVSFYLLETGPDTMPNR